ncbi:3,5-dihydroxyphenylacetyl-CoA synthase DpgA [Thiococcus pfennigii]|uniref:3,5-dihydroxyphenylacetyl-CoA synthase DpgA n=1 Tax=Thiococcus pfennigii TaxID=1057 RepID=UPI0019064C15|nr:3,5-dihydroxyphenylacetyl-CoA synthase DpgA [Thiococcus pfennigii]
MYKPISSLNHDWRQKAGFTVPEVAPRILSVGTATPPCKYTQEEVLELFQESSPKIRSVFLGGHIQSRYLYLPEPVDGALPQESNQQLLDKHLNGALEIGGQAIEECLRPLGLEPYDVDFFCALSTTGFLCPGITAHLIKKMGFRESVRRVDILGMGCNAGVNGLQTVTSYAAANPGKLGLLLCVEICSAAYVDNRSLSTAVVNSLFGDGAAAVLVRQDPADTWQQGPRVIDFESHIIPEALRAMRYDLDNTKLSFFLERDIPYVIGANVEKPVGRLLGRHGLKGKYVDHWIVHSGGKKVIDAIEYNIGLTNYDMRHTLGILRNYGNLSSGSILFSYKELTREGLIRSGDVGVVIAMGPGTSIETALVAW